MHMKIFALVFSLITIIAAGFLVKSWYERRETRAADARVRCGQVFGSDMGLPVYIRINKERRNLELLLKRESGWEVRKHYPILAMSGELGPKKAEGDYQAPEGYYEVYKRSLNPQSRFHLSFNIGYPNAYDRAQGYTGSFIMVHGGCSSIGCFSMGDDAIEEIYAMVEQALEKGQAFVPVQVYPFDMTDERMKREQNSPHYAFWSILAKGWAKSQLDHAPIKPAEDYTPSL